MEDLEQRLDYLEETNDMLLMQNRVLAAALQGFLRAMPPEMAENIVESVQAAFKTANFTRFCQTAVGFHQPETVLPFVQIFDLGTKGYAAAQRARLKTQ